MYLSPVLFLSATIASIHPCAGDARPLISDIVDQQLISFAFLNNDTFLTGASNGSITIWTLRSGILTKGGVHQLAKQAINQLAVIENGNTVVACTLRELLVYSLVRKQLIFAYHTESNEKTCINGFTVFPNEKQIAIKCGGDDLKVRIINLSEKKEVGSLATGERTHMFTRDGKPRPSSVAVSADCKLIAVSYCQVFFEDAHHVHIWDAMTFQHLYKFVAGQSSIAWSIAFHPTRSRLLVLPGLTDTIDLLDLDKLQRTIIRKLPPVVFSRELVYSCDGTHLLSSSDDGVIMLIRQGQERPIYKYDPKSTSVGVATFSPDGSLLGLLIEEVHENCVSRLFLFETATGKCVTAKVTP